MNGPMIAAAEAHICVHANIISRQCDMGTATRLAHNGDDCYPRNINMLASLE